MTDLPHILSALGMKAKPAWPQAPCVKTFALAVVKEYARLAMPDSPMRWEHTLRRKSTGKEYLVTITLEELP